MKPQQRQFDELPAAIIGRLGEIAASDAMKMDGASTISLCRIDTGGAPMLERGPVRGKLVLPDLQVFNWRGHKGACFIEIKTYEQSKENRTESKKLGYPVRVHGIPVRLYDHYCANETETGVPVYLAVNELDTGEMRVSALPLSQLEKIPCLCRGGCRSVDATKHESTGHGIREMQWYFDRDDMSHVYKHADKTIEKLRNEHARLNGHARQRHGTRRSKAPADLLAVYSRAACSYCSGPFSDTVFKVGPLGGSTQYALCGTCWRAGETPVIAVAQ